MIRTSRAPLILLTITSLCACSDGGSGGTGDAGHDAGPPAIDPLLAPHAEDAPLRQLGVGALALAPSWLRHDLGLALRQVPAGRADELAALLVDAPDPRLLDELAFTIARTSPERLGDEDFHAGVLLDNARLVYEHDEHLDYVRLIDTGTPGEDDDFSTTAAYLTADGPDGEIVEKTIDPETYYWFVVHPVMEDESPWYIDPWDPCYGASMECAADPRHGPFWRDALWDRVDEACPEPGHCPGLAGWMPGVEYLWNGLAGGESAGAVTEIVHFMRHEPVEGHRWLVFGAEGERSIQPNRIYGLGRGNCGEWADMTTALSRAALIPTANATPASWDHTWNVFWDDEWVAWEPVNFWVNHAYNAPYSNYASRGDGFILLQTPDYTDDWFTMEVLVTDAEGTPVVGAAVAVFSPWEIDGQTYWSYAGEAPTNENGVASFPLVAEMQYAERIETPIGNLPPADNTITYASEGVAAGDVDLRFYSLDATLPAGLPATEVGFDGEPAATLNIANVPQGGRTLTRGYRFETTYTTEVPAPELQLLLVDADNLALLEEGEEFEAAWAGAIADTEAEIPLDRAWYLVIANSASASVAALGELSVTLMPIPGAQVDDWSETLTVEAFYEILPGGKITYLIDPWG